jgi:hypothetical protein
MAKRGRRSIRNKRKSVKKYSSKRRSKTRRYLRGGQINQQIVSERQEYIIRKQEEFDNCMNPCKLITDEDKQYRCMKNCSKNANYDSSSHGDESDDDMGGGRRRYYRRKQSKSRSRKH